MAIIITFGILLFALIIIATIKLFKTILNKDMSYDFYLDENEENSEKELEQLNDLF